MGFLFIYGLIHCVVLCYFQYQTVRETRKTTEVVTTKKSKKEIKAVAKKHADVFGGEDDEEGGKFNASYSHLEDDFM